jgi:tetratricopeptide (TPR) repeat protein
VRELRKVSDTGGRRRRSAALAPGRLRARRAAGFLFAFALTLLLAFDGGGYDLVIRQEVGLAVWALIALGLATGALPRARLSAAAWVALGGFGAFAALNLLAHSWTDSDERTTAELARVLQYGGLVALAYLALNRYSWRGAALGFAAAALVVPFFAVGTRLFPGVLNDDVAQALGIDRLSYPLDYWNAVSCWGAMAIAVALALSANASRTGIRAAALATIPVSALSVYLTYSRFGVAAIAIAVIAAVALSRNRWTAVANAIGGAAAGAAVVLVTHGQDEIARATGDAGAATVVLAVLASGAGCAVWAAITSRAGLDRVRMDARGARVALAGTVAVALLAAIALHGPLGNAWDEFKNDRAPANTGTERFTSLGGTRYQVWSTAIDAFQEDPWRGVGPGTFEFYWSRHGHSQEFIRDAHSLYIEQLAELGIPGLVALLTALGGLLYAAVQARLHWRRRREIAVGSAMIAAFVVFLIDAGVDWMWELGALGTLAIGGVAVAGAGGLDRAGPHRPGRWLRLGLTLCALALAAVQVPGLVSTQRVRASDSELDRGRAASALDAAGQAIDAEPWAATPYAMRALVFERFGDLESAVADARDAIDREPDNWRNHLLLARLEAERDRRAASLGQLAEARRLAPLNPYLNPDSPDVRQIESLVTGANPASAGP